MEEATEMEVELIERMRKNLSDLHLEKPILETRNLVRFLRAKNCHVGKAEQMFRKQIEWRQQNDIDHILEWQIPPEYKATYWPWQFSGVDLLRNPVAVIPMGIWDPYKVRQISYDVYLRNNFYCLEMFWSVIQRQSRGQKTFNQASLILDFEGMDWCNVTRMDALHGTLESFRCFDANYPEILRVAFVVNTPYVFHIAWKLVQPLLSEHTRAKVHFLSGSDPAVWREELCNFIAPDQFPQKYGGDRPDDTEVDMEELCGLNISSSLDQNSFNVGE